MLRYWIMRVDHDHEPKFLWNELKAGRLRQGWGYQADQELSAIAAKKAKGGRLSGAQRDTWRGNRRMLPSEDDSIQERDIILVAHLPEYGRWSLVQVTGPYKFEIAKTGDHGHLLPVKLLSGERGVGFHGRGVVAGLRQTMRTRSRLWNIDDLGPAVAAIVAALKAHPTAIVEDDATDGLLKVMNALDEHGWSLLKDHFQGGEFEKPCVRLLEALYADATVEHTGGPKEKGADVICSYLDPLGIPNRVAVQIKMWTGEAGWTRPLQQLKKAVESYDGITAGVLISTAVGGTKEFEAERNRLQEELGIPIHALWKKDVVRLFLRHLPDLVGAADGADE